MREPIEDAFDLNWMPCSHYMVIIVSFGASPVLLSSSSMSLCHFVFEMHCHTSLLEPVNMHSFADHNELSSLSARFKSTLKRMACISGVEWLQYASLPLQGHALLPLSTLQKSPQSRGHCQNPRVLDLVTRVRFCTCSIHCVELVHFQQLVEISTDHGRSATTISDNC